jgi:cytochrome c oxidase subunit 2
MDDQQNDSQGLVAWILGIAVAVAIAVSLIIGILAGLGSGGASKPADAAAAPAAAVAIVEVDQPPAVATGAGYPTAISFFFETARFDLPPDAGAQLVAIVAYAKAAPNARIGISGYHDRHGDVEANRVLAKNRAMATRAALLAAGVPEACIVMVKPQETTGGSDDRQARRVDVYPAQ